MTWSFFGKPSFSGDPEVDAIFEKLARFLEDEHEQIARYPEPLRKRMIAGSDVDENANKFGEFGFTLTNPVPVNGPIGEVIYLSSLRSNDGSRVLFHRIGSLNEVDIYESVTSDGKKWDLLYFDMYHPRKSKKSPRGYKIASRDSALWSGVNYEISNFPMDLYEAIIKSSQNMTGMSIADPSIRIELENNSFIRPLKHTEMVKDVRRGNIPSRSRISAKELAEFAIDREKAIYNQITELKDIGLTQIG